MGLDRVQTEDDIKVSALKKWQGFLRQHVMQNLEQVSTLINNYALESNFSHELKTTAAAVIS